MSQIIINKNNVNNIKNNSNTKISFEAQRKENKSACMTIEEDNLV